MTEQKETRVFYIEQTTGKWNYGDYSDTFTQLTVIREEQ